MLQDQTLPLVMPSNNSNAHKLEEQYPGRMGLLMSPDGWRDPRGLPYALDNGKYACHSTGKHWDQDGFTELLDKAARCEQRPRWVTVPDEVADADYTFTLWDLWAGQLKERGLTIALAVQDGMTPGSVNRRTVRGSWHPPDVIFIGGTTSWKRRTLWSWCQAFPRVHVGRVNQERWLWNAHRCGAESTDGTGWFRGDQKQLAGLHRYLQRSSQGLNPPQLELEFSSTFTR